MIYVQIIAYRYHNVPLNTEPKNIVFKFRFELTILKRSSKDESITDFMIRLIHAALSAKIKYLKNVFIFLQSLAPLYIK